MSHTNSTANLGLPQFIGTDKPTWLSDVNGAFAAIDSYAGSNDAALAITDGKADTAIADASNAVTTAGNAATTAGNAATTATNANTVAGNALTIVNNTAAKMGDLTNLVTTDKSTLVAAINEVAGYGAPAASAVSYDNTGSGLTAANVQDAIDELAQGGSTSPIKTVTSDGVKTQAQIVNEFFAELANIGLNSYFTVDNSGVITIGRLTKKDSTQALFSCTRIEGSSLETTCFTVASSSSVKVATGTTVTDASSTVITSGIVFSLYA